MRLWLKPWQFSFLFSVAAAFCCQAGADAPLGYRTALLIGHSSYEGFSLGGVKKSLDLVEQALSKHGYAITRHENLDEKELKAVADVFSRSVPTNGVAVIYYAGLGAHTQRQGRPYNLLRPVGATIRNEGDYRSRALNIVELTKTFNESCGSRVNLFFIDACWQSPVKPADDKVKSGMVAFDPGGETTVMFAAASGAAKPAPKSDAASPMAKALASHVAELDTSVKSACTAMATELGNAWVGNAPNAGIGVKSASQVVNTPDAAASAGDGFVNAIGMAFRWCPPGDFTMGSDRIDAASTRDRKAVNVKLSQGFWIGEHEVTQREHYAVTRKNPGRGFTTSKNAPYWGVGEAKHIDDFCKKLNDLERKAGRLPDGWTYACPTEAQWEYACRAGSTTAYCFGDAAKDLGLYGNFADKTLWVTNPDYNWASRDADDGVAEALAPVGSYLPNAWGIRDMHGNVAEIVADHLQPTLPGGADPLVRQEKEGRTVIRGGAWCSVPLYCESSFRNALSGRDKLHFVGFRIILKKSK